MSLFSSGQEGLRSKMKRFYRGQITVDRALMHYGISPVHIYGRVSTIAPEGSVLKEWATQQPWLEVRDCMAFRHSKDVPSYKLVLVEGAAESAIAPEEVAK